MCCLKKPTIPGSPTKTEMDVPSSFGDLFRKIALKKSIKERKEKNGGKTMEVITYATHDLVVHMDPPKDVHKKGKKNDKKPTKIDGWYVLTQQLQQTRTTKVKTLWRRDKSGKRRPSHALTSPPPTRMLMSRRNRKVAEMELSDSAVKPLSPLPTSYPGSVNKDAWY